MFLLLHQPVYTVFHLLLGLGGPGRIDDCLPLCFRQGSEPLHSLRTLGKGKAQTQGKVLVFHDIHLDHSMRRRRGGYVL